MSHVRALLLFVAAVGLVCLVAACPRGNVHPGQKLLRVKCAGCHSLQDRTVLREQGFDQVIAIHGDTPRLTPEQRAQMKAFVESGP